MGVGRQIEKIRQECGLSIVDVCNIFCVSERDYHRIITNKIQPSIFQLCVFIEQTHCPLNLDSILKFYR